MTKKRFLHYVTSFHILTILTLSHAAITGNVVDISDGDTITILDSTNTQQKIHLLGIDCPESHQDFGTQAKQITSEMVFGKTV